MKNYQKDKYRALKGSENTLRKLAKEYDYKLPKNINKLDVYQKRLSNYIEKLQFKNYHEGTPDGIQEGKDLKLVMERTGVNKSQAMKILKSSKQYAKALSEISKEGKLTYGNKKKVNEANVQINNLISKGYTDYKTIITKMNDRTLANNGAEALLDRLKDSISSNYLQEGIERMGLQNSYKEKELLKKFNKLSMHKKLTINANLWEVFKDKYKKEDYWTTLDKELHLANLLDDALNDVIK